MKKTITFSVAALLLGGTVFGQIPRKVIAEDFTGEWCGWCPLGRTAAEHMDSYFQDQIINIGMHYGDPLANTYSNAVNNIDTYGYPGFLIDRKVLYGNFWQGVGSYAGDDLDWLVQAELNQTSPVGVTISSTYNASTRALNVTLTANFAAATTGTMYLNCVLIEDSISTPGVQHNYMNTTSASPWYNMGDPITNYYQRDVARVNLSATTWGDAGVIPASVSAGSTYSKSYTYTVPAGDDVTHMKIVGFVSHYATGSTSGVDTTNIDVLNANDARFGQTIIQGIDQLTASNLTTLDVYPNPSVSGNVTIPFHLTSSAEVSVKIYDMMGQQVADLADGSQAPGDHLLRWDGTHNGSAVAKGVYFCVIQSGNQHITKRITIQ